ncbi:MAG: GAF domain-containing protein [Cytophagales bacterium]|nr:GAF domain-containing protein [Cytophagales bacterium]
MIDGFSFPPSGVSKDLKYSHVNAEISSLLSSDLPQISGLANTASVLKYGMGFFWVGFYLLTEDRSRLVLGPFQGEPACVYIPYGKGVCGSACLEKRTIIVPDVDAFPGHIACSSRSRSEIVVPIIREGEVLAVLDVDSETKDAFDETDQKHLETLAQNLRILFLT